jgi:cyanophycinase
MPKGKLIIIGGSVDKGSFSTDAIDLPKKLKFFEHGILNRIIKVSMKNNLSRIEIITTASNIPEEVGVEYVKAFGQLNVNDVGVLNIKTREEANSPVNIERLRNADVVMFSGGDQLRLTSIFGGTAFHRLLMDKYENEGFVISGTSAGAAASSNNMIYQGSSQGALLKGEVKITGGLGFINNVIIDTHFVQRGRIGRLLYACGSNPINLGIGLGEDTGLLITDGHSMEAIGSGLIILVDGTSMGHTNMSAVEMGEPVSIENLIVHVMSIGDHFDLKTRKLKIDHFKPVLPPKEEDDGF